MPIEMEDFEGGEVPRKKVIQRNILKVLRRNPNAAISSREFEGILNTRRQNVNQALRALERKGLVRRGLMKEGSRDVVYASIVPGKEEDVDGEINGKEKV